MSSIKDKLSKIDKDYYQILTDIGKVSKETGQKSYLVGGMVRDLLLGFENLDIDIVVENNAKQLAETLTKKFPNCELSAKHDRFHTAKVIFNINGKKIPIDLASTREETYEKPAALPNVKVSDLKSDLIRRDFTINALAISLMPDDFGEVVDLFDGLVDLKNKKIRVLHDGSFIDDPTRMIRAIRFAAKLGFEIEPHTKDLLKQAIDSKQFDNLIEKIRGDRVKIEIRYLFNLPDVVEATKAFFESGIFKMISTELKRNGDRATGRNGEGEKKWLIYLGLIMKDLKAEEQDKIMKNLQMTSDEIKTIKSAYKAYEKLQDKNIDSINVHKILKDLSPESISILKLLTPEINNLIDEYLTKTSKIKLEITGDDLKKMGVKEGKQIGEILEKILELKIKNPGMKKEDEVKEVKKLLQY